MIGGSPGPGAVNDGRDGSGKVGKVTLISD